MLDEVLTYLTPAAGEVYLDGTFGNGGYSRAILEKTDCHLIAVDQDAETKERVTAFQKKYGARFCFSSGNFRNLAAHIAHCGRKQVDGIVLDIGVSSMQLDQEARGFSFRFDGPLDMRMDRSRNEVTAGQLVMSLSESDLANLIYQYGEERLSRRIARRIVEARTQKPIETTFELADLIRQAYPKDKSRRIDPATRTFQALRIAVNDELGALSEALKASIALLRPGGRLVVVTFHSLEDGIVKDFMRKNSRPAARPSRHLPEQSEKEEARLFEDLTRKPVLPSEAEMQINPRARSAKLRAVRRLDTQVQS
jgi:16S rRNA (cytosine1402-N4)-methyltransferase